MVLDVSMGGIRIEVDGMIKDVLDHSYINRSLGKLVQ